MRKFKIGDGVRVREDQRLKAIKLEPYKGCDGVVVGRPSGRETNGGEGHTWVWVAFSNSLGKSVGIHACWMVDLELHEPPPSDEEILRLFQVPAHEHVCGECGMRMPDAKRD